MSDSQHHPILPPPSAWVDARRAEGLDDDTIQERWEKGTTRLQRHVIRTRPTSQQQRPILPPPSVWADARRAEGLNDDAIRERWEKDTPPTQRRRIRMQPRSAIRAYHRHHGDEEVAAASARASHAAAVQRQSASRLAFHAANTKGCAVDGCALAPGASQLLPAGLFVYARRDGHGKTGVSWSLDEAKQQAALAEMDCLCLWHFFVRGREQQQRSDEEKEEEGNAPSSSRSQPSSATSRLSTLKAATVACQHPVHAFMPYATLVLSPAGEDAGFFAAALCRQPGGLPRRIGGETVAVRLRELEAGTARFECKFCRQLTTMCERAKMHDTVNCQAQFQLLLRLAPAFVQHFEEATADVDWAAECARLNANKTGPRGDRKRKEPPPAASSAAAAAAD